MNQKLGQALQSRARELGLSDAEVARRVDIGQSRYANYVSGVREPDFATFVKICRALAITPNDALGFTAKNADEPAEEILRDRIAAAATAMDAETLRRTAAIMDTFLREIGEETNT
jgi:transcriptional regulator with XRE-family HTH domain